MKHCTELDLAGQKTFDDALYMICFIMTNRSLLLMIYFNDETFDGADNLTTSKAGEEPGY